VNDIVEVPASRRHSRLPAWLLALRPRHWVKNVLVIVPLAAAHQLGDLALLARVAMAFAAFSLCASGLYVLNDLFDLEADRSHPSKRRRPLASGEMTRTTAFALIAVMWLGAALVAAQLGMAFSGVLAAYVLLMIAYSVHLKHVVLLDALLLAAGYSARIAAGAVAALRSQNSPLVNLTPADLRAHLRNTAQKPAGETPGYDIRFGHGILNLEAALQPPP
jgi:4-hydroxybenzoate polyprenyltransferase